MGTNSGIDFKFKWNFATLVHLIILLFAAPFCIRFGWRLAELLAHPTLWGLS